MLWFLRAIPVVGKAIDAFAAYYNKKQDVDLEKYKVKGQLDTEAIKADVAIIQARAELAAAHKDDPAAKWGRRLLIYPTGVWYLAIVWRSLVQEHPTLSEYSWVIKALPANLDYIPYAVVAYLLVTAWRGR